ncbi:MAG: hypothetical protein NT069_21340, partial [Planctomycetota bacterium]|nr:hypothetical protein [Planctomycetota bacterium]
PQDVARLSHGEALSDSLIWSVLALGGRRDLRLVKTLKEYSSLAELKTRGQVATRMGVIPGNKKKELTELRDKPYFELTEFPENVFVELDASTVSPWTVPKVDSLHGIKNFEEFKLPQLLVKHSYSVNKKRFRAAIVRSSDPTWGVICKETYLSVRDLTPDAKHIGGACLVYNSLLATYFLALTSSRMGHYITEVLTGELMQVPLPSVPVDLSQLRTFDDIDALTRKLFRLTEADWVLVDDLLNVALPDALRKSGTPGRQSTRGAHARTPGEPVLEPYGTTFRRVLQTTFGRQRDIAFTILQEPEGNRLPVRVVTVHLDWVGRPPISVERMEADGLFDHIADFQRQLEATPGRGSMASGGGFQRVAYLFHSHDEPGGPVCDLTIIKPDQVRYWTRAQAMRDADELSSAILAAAAQGKVLE